ncbi:hypothetical protein V1478_014888 [Vespula squamosa]|uniref:Uncharacterized protein n=1 Tax=Vespula squamosa TaxID=30214 RepID=A0ABD2A653_VESSQ
MEKATATRVKKFGCECWKNKIPIPKKKQRDRCKRKRQTLVFNVNADDEIWHEPYMQRLQKEFSDVSILCDSKIELPWKDIALPTVVRKIRTADNSVDHGKENAENGGEVDLDETERKESNGFMMLPWHKLLITNVVTPSKVSIPACCDSTVEIPWEDLALDKPVNIRVPPTDEKDSCVPDDLEIPWQDILVPQNIVIEVPKKNCTSMNGKKKKK